MILQERVRRVDIGGRQIGISSDDGLTIILIVKKFVFICKQPHNNIAEVSRCDSSPVRQVVHHLRVLHYIGGAAPFRIENVICVVRDRRVVGALLVLVLGITQIAAKGLFLFTRSCGHPITVLSWHRMRHNL